MRKYLFFAALCAAMSVQAVEWQWCVPVKGMVSEESGKAPEVFLWVPPFCERLNAVLYVHQNMTEEVLIGDSWFRSEMAKIDVGIVYVAPGDYKWNDAESSCQTYFKNTMKELADVSGYKELEFLPVIPFGHSAQATFPWNFAAWNAERTLAVISYHGDSPRTNLCGYGRENVEWGRTRNIDGIPGLMIEGEYEWWEARVNPSLAFRIMYPEACISFLCDAGRGHFDMCHSTIDYMARFIAKAVELRIPSEGLQADGRVTLNKINPMDGWLCDRWRDNQKKRPKAASYNRYKGDRHDAFWYFDEEMATLTEQRYAGTCGKKMQYVSFSQSGALLPFNPKSHVKINVPLRPEADGITFHLKGEFTDSTKTAFSDLHAKGVKPCIKVISGPCIQIDDTTFQVAFHTYGLSNRRRWSGITLCVEADGDGFYKPAVQELNVSIPENGKGLRQSISFPSLQDVSLNDLPQSIPLNATADSGLPVGYYVKQGPAYVSEGRLVFTAIPQKARFPMQVTVVAWQIGTPGQFSAAAPVERTFFINK